MDSLTLRPFLSVYRLVLRLERTVDACKDILSQVCASKIVSDEEHYTIYKSVEDIIEDFSSLGLELEPSYSGDEEQDTKYGPFGMEDEKSFIFSSRDTLFNWLGAWDLESSLILIGELKDFLPSIQDRLVSLRKYLEDEVGSKLLFLSLEDKYLRNYLSPRKFLVDFERTRLKLPRISKIYLEDSGKALAYGIPTAAIGLSLQAVEAVLRYYCFRHNRGGPKNTWGELLGALGKNRMPPPKNRVYRRLEDLLLEHRNIILHGRTQLGPAAFTAAVDVVNECWWVIRRLVESSRSCLNIKLDLPEKFDLDTSFAAFLFFWNNELPPITIDNNVRFGQVQQGEMLDFYYPGSEVKSQDGYVFKGAITHLKLQDQSLRIFEEVTIPEFIENRKNGEQNIMLMRKSVREDDLDLEDIFDLIYFQYPDPDEAGKRLDEVWRLFHTMIDQRLDPCEPNLLAKVGLNKYYYENIKVFVEYKEKEKEENEDWVSQAK